MYPEVLPDLLASRPTVLFGRYDSVGSTQVTVRGEHNGKPIEYIYEVEFPEENQAHESLPVMWARSKVEKLQRDLWHGPERGTVREITQLGIHFGLVTPYTSFVAVDSSRQHGDGSPRLIDLLKMVDEHHKTKGQEGSDNKILKSVNLFDVYEGEKLPEGKKSYALSFTISDETKTLTDKQVDIILSAVVRK